jgi:hypothetical protein
MFTYVSQYFQCPDVGVDISGVPARINRRVRCRSVQEHNSSIENEMEMSLCFSKTPFDFRHKEAGNINVMQT